MNRTFSLVSIIILSLVFNISAASSETKNLRYVKKGVDENNIKIVSFNYEFKNGTCEIKLTCEAPEDMGYSFFNPPEGDKIMFFKPEGLKKGVNAINLEFPEKSYNDLTEKILTFSFRFKAADKEAYLVTNFGDHKLPFDDGTNEITSLPVYDEKSDKLWQVDLRGADVSKINVADRFNDLIHADFDTDTRWPSKLPEKFDPAKIMQLGKMPGLNLVRLHEKGITAKGVSIAVIDQKLLRDHDEYAGRIKHYEEIKCSQSEPQMHSAAVVSLAAGKTVGAAPQADIYYIATTFGTSEGDKNFDMNFTPLAEAINKILDINLKLPKPEKIRVISVSVGWMKNSKGYEDVMKAAERAKKDGVFLISTSLDEVYGFEIYGLGRTPLSDPDDVNSYMPGIFWSSDFYKYPERFSKPMLLVPMDSRTYAGHSHKSQYSFNSEGGLSWAVPYAAGVYALMCQVKPDLTPEIFWKAALDTGSEITLKKDGKEIKFGKILNPVKLKDALAR